MGVGMSKRCSFIKTDGNRCRAYATNDSEFCFFHVANGAGARLAGARGGRNSKAAERARRIRRGETDVRSFEDVISLLEESINEVRSGQVDSRVANSVGYLANILIKALDQGRLQSRMDFMERNGELLLGLGLSSPVEVNGEGEEG
jgi:hypothetical protein